MCEGCRRGVLWKGRKRESEPCIANYSVCLSVQSVLWTNSDRPADFPMPVTLGLCRGTFFFFFVPSYLPPPEDSAPLHSERLDHCPWSWTFFAFDFIANWPTFWVDCLCYRTKGKKPEPKGKETPSWLAYLKCQDSCLGWVSWYLYLYLRSIYSRRRQGNSGQPRPHPHPHLSRRPNPPDGHSFGKDPQAYLKCLQLTSMATWHPAHPAS